MRVALIDSGLGVLPAAAALLELAPSCELVLSYDPDGMPWGDKTPRAITERALLCLDAASQFEPDAIVLACNTLSVTALDLIRGRCEPAVPVVATVPAIKPAAASGWPIAIWATARTTGSAYQHDLINRFAPNVPVTEVACPGLADAIESGDLQRVREKAGVALSRTPSDTQSIVLGCTQYELAADQIAMMLDASVRLHQSGEAVARQVLRRIDSNTALTVTGPQVTVLESGRRARLPDRCLTYPAGKKLAELTTPGFIPLDSTT